MTEITFLRPDVLWMVPVAAVAVVLWRLIRRKRYVAFSAVGWLDRLPSRPSPVRRLPALLIVAGLALTMVALMEPVLPYSEGRIQAQGLDIVLLLDLSSSMQEVMDLRPFSRPITGQTFSARDVAPRQPEGKTRLETTKDALRDFIRRRRDDRVGLVVFSDHAYVVSPLTFDYENLLNYVDTIDDQILRGEGMTAIGSGLGLSNYLLARQSDQEYRNKVIVVFTDGENNFGPDPLGVLAESDAAGFRVHVIGVDLEDRVKQNPAVLRLIEAVRQYGGQYYSADTVRQLRAAYGEIDSLEKGLLTSTTYVRNVPVFVWFVRPALVLLLLGLCVRVIPYFADYT